jgi:LuxR family transcriptional regulator
MANIGRVKSLLEQVENLSSSGFAIAFHIRLTSPDFLFQTYPKDWIDIYSEKGYVMVDPIVRWGFTQTGAIRWSGLGDLDDQNILKQSLAYGMAYGVAGFARKDREYTDDEINVLTQHVQDLHEQTASRTGMDETLRNELHDLSVNMTHPAATSD